MTDLLSTFEIGFLCVAKEGKCTSCIRKIDNRWSCSQILKKGQFHYCSQIEVELCISKVGLI